MKIISLRKPGTATETRYSTVALQTLMRPRISVRMCLVSQPSRSILPASHVFEDGLPNCFDVPFEGLRSCFDRLRIRIAIFHSASMLAQICEKCKIECDTGSTASLRGFRSSAIPDQISPQGLILSKRDGRCLISASPRKGDMQSPLNFPASFRTIRTLLNS